MTAPDRIWLDWFLAKDLYAYDTPAPKLTPKETEFVRRDPAVLAALPEVQALEDAAYERAADALLGASVWCDSQATTSGDWHNGVRDACKHHMNAIRAMKGTKG